jgi:hypothetical protein
MQRSSLRRCRLSGEPAMAEYVASAGRGGNHALSRVYRSLPVGQSASAHNRRKRGRQRADLKFVPAHWRNRREAPGPGWQDKSCDVRHGRTDKVTAVNVLPRCAARHGTSPRSPIECRIPLQPCTSLTIGRQPWNAANPVQEIPWGYLDLGRSRLVQL